MMGLTVQVLYIAELARLRDLDRVELAGVAHRWNLFSSGDRDTLCNVSHENLVAPCTRGGGGLTTRAHTRWHRLPYPEYDAGMLARPTYVPAKTCFSRAELVS